MGIFKFLGCDVSYHDSWCSFFGDVDNITHLHKIEAFLCNNKPFTPFCPKDIFKVFLMDLNNCKVVILGLDPYPKNNDATGRAFEVRGLRRWHDKVNPSLRKILILLHANYSANSPKSPTDMPQVRSDITKQNFKILPPHELFVSWEKQGVLLLNTALTCKVNKSQSHLDIWKDFTKNLIRFIGRSACPCKNIYWFLWGRDAERRFNLSALSGIHNIHYFSYHPSSQNKRWTGKKYHFFSQNHFRKFDMAIKCCKHTPNSINWLG